MLAAEWLKLRKRPITWILFAVFIVLLILQMLGHTVISLLFSGQTVTGGGVTGFQIEEYQRRASFPGIFGAIFGHINGIGGIMVVILTAASFGSEYSYGTLRTILARQPNRIMYFFNKLAALLLLITVGMLLTIVIGCLIGWGLGFLINGSGPISGTSLLEIPLALLRALYIFLPYILLTSCFCILGRSLLAGVAGGLIYLVLEAGLGLLAFFAQINETWKMIYNLTIGQNINTLVMLNSQAFGLRPEVLSPSLQLDQLPSTLQATLLVGIYSIIFLATALHFLFWRDVQGPN